MLPNLQIARPERAQTPESRDAQRSPICSTPQLGSSPSDGGGGVPAWARARCTRRSSVAARTSTAIPPSTLVSARPGARDASPYSTPPPCVSSPFALESSDVLINSDRLLFLLLCCVSQGEGDWAITSVLHDATAVVISASRFHWLFGLRRQGQDPCATGCLLLEQIFC